MTFALIAALLGGLGLFLLGMWLLTEGLKVAAGDALRRILDTWTRSAPRGLAAGALITAVAQSSSAVTVATVGFVNAGLLTLAQAIWVVFGANLGTTMTGWLVALIGIRVSFEALALPMIGLGMLVWALAGSRVRPAGAGQAVAGFGLFFLGIGVLQESFGGLASGIDASGLPDLGFWALPAFVLLGVVVTLLTQSSSAAIAIALTATAGGALPLTLAAGAVVGANLGTTVTAILAAIGATAPARRVAAAHVVFNAVTAMIGLGLIVPLTALSAWLAVQAGPAGIAAGPATQLAMFHTLFNLLGVVSMTPFAPVLLRMLSARFVTEDEQLARPRHLDRPLLQVPDLAFEGLLRETRRLHGEALSLVRARLRACPGRLPDTPARHAGMLRLARSIQEFAAELGKATLPESLRDALPELLRAVTHLENMIGHSRSFGHAGLPADLLTRPHWAELRDAVAEALEPEGDEATLAARAARLDQAYLETKGAVLQQAALGQMGISPLDEALVLARDLRTTGRANLRYLRRLPASRIAGPDPQEPVAQVLPGDGG